MEDIGPLERTGRSALLGALLVAVVSIAAHVDSLPNDYVLDDIPAVVDNPAAHWPVDFSRIVTTNYWGDRPNYEKLTIYRPLATLSFALMDAYRPEGPSLQRAVNLLVHAGCAVLVFLILLKCCTVWGAALGGLLFAVHPVHTEAVIGVVSRAELLAAFFVLLGTFLWQRSFESRAQWSVGRRVSSALVMGLVFALALLSKENGVTLWGVLLAFQLVHFLGQKQRSAIVQHLHIEIHGVMALVLAGYLALRAAVLPAVLGGDVPYSDNPMVGGDFVVRWLTPFKVFLEYVGLLVSPAHLTIDYSLEHFKVARSLGDWQGWAGLLLFAGLTGGALAAARRRPVPAVLLLSFFATYSVISNLPFLSTIIMAERLIYLPSAFLLAAVASLGASAAQSGRWPGRILAVGALLVAILFAAGTAVRCREWRTPLDLYRAAVREAPDSAKSRHLLGLELAMAGRPDEALPHLQRSVEINPENFKARTNLARALAALGRYDEALVHLKTVLTQAPGHRAALDVVCGIFERTGKPPAAGRVCR